MAREVTFSTGTVIGSAFLNDQQDVQSAEAWGVRLKKATNTLIAVAPARDGSAAGSASIRINGKPRIIAAQITIDLSGTAAGTRDMYALAGFGPDFELAHLAAGAAAPADARKIGEVDWDGAQITAVRNMIDAVPGHGWLHRPGGDDPLPTGPAITLAADSTNKEGTAAAFARADHVHALDASIARKDSPVFTGFVDSPEYRVSGSKLASTHLSDTANLVRTDDARLTNQRVPIDGTVTNAKLAAHAVTLAKVAVGHGLSFNCANVGGSGAQCPANTSVVLTQINFQARANNALIVSYADFLEVRGGAGYASLIAGIAGVASIGNVWYGGGGLGGSGFAVLSSGVVPGRVYTAQTYVSVANSPVTFQAHGNALVLVFDMP